MNDLEIWKKIIINDEQTNYSVSSVGNVRNDNTGRILKKSLGRTGYHSVALHINKAPKRIETHILVCSAFNGNKPSTKHQVDHINSVRTDNRYQNLQWLTVTENMVKARAKTWYLISPEKESIEVYNLEKFCRENNLSSGSMHNVYTGKYKQHKGWTFSPRLAA